jgi:hypothetical protein
LYNLLKINAVYCNYRDGILTGGKGSAKRAEFHWGVENSEKREAPKKWATLTVAPLSGFY